MAVEPSSGSLGEVFWDVVPIGNLITRRKVHELQQSRFGPVVSPFDSREPFPPATIWSPMDSRLASSNSMKAMKISMESERMFNDVEEEMPPSPTRDLRSRLSSRVMSPSNSSSTRLSVKDQLYALECKVQSHEDTVQKMMSIHQADKAVLMSKIEEITERMSEELHKLRLDYQKKLNTASEEIERLNKCLNVQRGHITTLQEQCQSLHKHVVQVDDDVTKLAAEVFG